MPTMKQTEDLEIRIYHPFTGDLIETVTLDDLVATGQNFDVHLTNYGLAGSHDFELWIPNTKYLAGLISQGRSTRKELNEQPKSI